MEHRVGLEAVLGVAVPRACLVLRPPSASRQAASKRRNAPGWPKPPHPARNRREGRHLVVHAHFHRRRDPGGHLDVDCRGPSSEAFTARANHCSSDNRNCRDRPCDLGISHSDQRRWGRQRPGLVRRIPNPLLRTAEAVFAQPPPSTDAGPVGCSSARRRTHANWHELQYLQGFAGV